MKKRFYYLFIFVLFTIVQIYGQVSTGTIPPSYKEPASKSSSIAIPAITLPEINVDNLLKEDAQRQDSALRIGKLIDVDIDFLKQSQKETLTNHSTIYLLKITVPGAKSVDLVFDSFYVPEGGELFVYKPDYSEIAGAFTSVNNKATGKFSIGPIAGEEVILEYMDSKFSTETPELHLDYVGHNYIDLERAFLKSTSATDCFIDVQCNPFVDKNIIRSVMRWRYYEGGSTWFCSCALVNQDVDDPNDLRYYVLTANHCGNDADLSTARFFFNYQKPGCNTGSGTTRYYTTGATKIAKRAIYDMFLMELIEAPPADYNVFFAWWDRQNWWDLFSFVTGIHHPLGWVKKVSEGHLADNTNPDFWRVRWDDAPTDDGSSGSPLFEEWNYRIIGWDSYGLAGCNLLLTTQYGKLRGAWTGPSDDKELRHWLDPDDNDKTGIDGRDPCFDNVNISNRFDMGSALDYQPDNHVIIQAGNEITTSGTVNILSGADFTFRAGNRVRLNPGFSVATGAAFRTEAGNCLEYKYSSLKNKSMMVSGRFSLNPLTDQNINENLIKIYPNPGNGIFTFEITDLEDIKYIKIVNLLGDIVYQNDNLNSSLYQINLSHVNRGIYLVKICQGSLRAPLKTCFLVPLFETNLKRFFIKTKFSPPPIFYSSNYQ